MPAILTHHIFGTEVYSELAQVVGLGDAKREAFLLGNIGPDPLFCLKFLPGKPPHHKLGWVMHGQRTPELLAAFHRHFIEEGSTNTGIGGTTLNTSGPDSHTPKQASFSPSLRPTARAYALGFLCHYLLDSTVHPLVYAQQHAICAAGIGGIDERYSGTVHAMIETVLDEHVLTKKLGVTANAFAPHRETLKCPGDALIDISARYSAVARDAYDMQAPTSAFSASVLLYRGAQFAIDSKRSGLRRRLDYARIVGKHYPHLVALTHKALLRENAPFTNSDHVSWPHPFIDGETVNASFGELYDDALDRARELVVAFAQPTLACETLARITRGVNFKGQPLSGEYDV